MIGDTIKFSAIPDSDFIEREAMLFEAGDYTDTHGVEVTEADLDTMIGNFQESPIKIEHTSTPFDGALGMLKSVIRKGKELWGMLSFNPAAWTLAEQAGAKKLSLGITRDKTKIAEVSLVNNPRIADAQVFSFSLDMGDVLSREDVVSTFAALWAGKETTSQEVIKVADEKNPVQNPGESGVEFKTRLDAAEKVTAEQSAKIADLQFQIRQRDVKSTLDGLKREGKLIPACEEFAQAILMHGDSTLKFGETDTTVSALFGKFMAALPVLVDFKEVGPGGKTEEKPVEFSDDVIDFTLKARPDLKTREAVVEFLKKYGG